MSFICLRGHHSISDDYCDVCGAKNRNVMQRFMSNLRPVTPGQTCPHCDEPRLGDDRYCARCAYDFETGERLELAAPRHAAVAPTAPTPAPPPYYHEPAAPEPTMFVLALTVDSRPNEAGCPRPPADSSERVFILDQPSMVIGRDDATGLQIPIHGDPYVSRHHAEIVELDDGWGVRDLGSTNGTKVNGVTLAGSEVKPLGLDDVIELGCFSRLTVRMRSHREWS
jgi:FHA domain